MWCYKKRIIIITTILNNYFDVWILLEVLRWVFEIFFMKSGLLWNFVLVVLSRLFHVKADLYLWKQFFPSGYSGRTGYSQLGFESNPNRFLPITSIIMNWSSSVPGLLCVGVNGTIPIIPNGQEFVPVGPIFKNLNYLPAKQRIHSFISW